MYIYFLGYSDIVFSFILKEKKRTREFLCGPFRGERSLVFRGTGRSPKSREWTERPCGTGRLVK